MTYLSYNGTLRKETDETAIANLVRKGWQETPPPSYDPATHHAPQWVDGGWTDPAAKTEEELAAEARAEARATLRASWANVDDKFLGPFWPVFKSVNELLDLEKDGAAREAILAVQPLAGWDAETLAEFEQLKTAFVAGIDAL